MAPKSQILCSVPPTPVCDKKGAMLRRLSDVTIGSIEKFLKIGGREKAEKKRKFDISESEGERDNDNFVDKEVIIKVIKVH